MGAPRVVNLPRAIPKAAKRSSRYRSQAHCKFVRSRACCVCDSISGVECAHVRIGSGAGMGQKPHDWRTVGLCKECHDRQHRDGEVTFWQGRDVEAIIDAYCAESPRKHQIREHRNGR